jgi:hypothetical protein
VANCSTLFPRPIALSMKVLAKRRIRLAQVQL